MNGIGKITFELNMQNESFARELYARWDSFFAAGCERVTEAVLSSYDHPEYVIEIPALELDLGEFQEDDFYASFPLRYREKLDELLLTYLNQTQTWERMPRKIAEGRALFEALAHFLLHGTFGWHVPDAYKNVRCLFLAVLEQEPKAFCYFLQTYGHYTSLRERFVYQLDDPELEKGVKLLEPSHAVFICSYVRLLQEQYTSIPRPVLNKRSYRNVVWQVVYTYLLSDRSSYFNKKSFVAQTILQLGAAHNLSYEILIHSIASELERFTGRLTVPVELFVLLGELKKELSERENPQSGRAAELYRTVVGFLQKEVGKGIRPKMREKLILLLSGAESCRLFLQQMSEVQIRELVGVVAPQESVFVLDTAHSLEEQQRQGALEGKVGGEFRLLKWQIIFPLLFANRGAGLNRRYFIEHLLKQIAAHYNLFWMDLLAYVHETEEIHKWAAAEKPKDVNSAVVGAKLPVFDSEEAYRDFVKKYFPDQADFISTYAAQLDGFKERGGLEGKAGGEFALLKWKFVLHALFYLPPSVFNRKFFVEQTLQCLAAHYNLSYLDVLIYFRTEGGGVYVPQALREILEELFDRAKGRWIELLVKGCPEEVKRKALRLLSPREHVFVESCLQAMGRPFVAGGMLGKGSGGFGEIKWRVVFEVLLEMEGAAFNKKSFVSRMLNKLAAHYNLSLQELLSCILQVKEYGHPLFRTFFIIVKELHTGELNDRQRAGAESKEGRQAVAEAERRMLLQWIKTMRLYFLQMFGISLNDQELIRMVGKMQDADNHLPVAEKVRLISEWAARFLTREQRALFDRFVCREQALRSVEKEEDQVSGLFVSNAGLVLLGPYLPRLFSLTGMMGEDAIFSPENAFRAVFLMQYAVTGKLPLAQEKQEWEEYREAELVLNKLLAGRLPADPIETGIELTEAEIQTVESMLKGVLGNWPRLGDTSVEGLRETFLMRPGKLMDKGGHYELTVEEKSYDLLLDTIPWNFKTICYSWMKKPIQVKWR